MSDERWTPDRMPDLHGSTALVTGANSGIGLHTVIELARHGAHVVMTSRDAHRGDEALGQVRVQVPGSSVETVGLDLADLSSVRDAAADVRERHPRLQLLVNNAGVMALPQRRLTADGFEMQLGTNHLGHFALTGLLLPCLLTAPSRVVTVSSNAHRTGRIAFDDLQGERYNPWQAYGQSKLANLLFTMELQRRADRAAVDLTSVGAHPGLAATNLVLSGPGSRSRLAGRVGGLAVRMLGQSSRMGSWPTLYAATVPGVQGAEYVGPGSLGGWRGHPVRTTASGSAYDPDVAAQLWQRSVELTGVGFDALTSPD